MTPQTQQKPAFIYLSGASATGKTHLAGLLAAGLDAEVYTGAARGVIARWPKTTQEMLAGEDRDEYARFQQEVLRQQIRLEATASWRTADGKSVVLDRGIDHLGYMAHFCPSQFATPCQEVADHLRTFQAHLTSDRTAGLVVYMPPVRQYLEKARQQRAPALQPFLTDEAVYGVDAAIKGLLLPFASSGRVVSLAGLTTDSERLARISRALEAVRNPLSEQYKLAV